MKPTKPPSDHDHVAGKLSRLYPKHVDPTREASGQYVPLWAREDAQAVAAAMGLYAGGHPGRRFACVLLRARGWPESVTEAEHRSMRAAATSLLANAYATWPGPGPGPEYAPTMERLQGSGALVDMLLAELLHPGPTPGYRARAERLRISAHLWRTHLADPYDSVLSIFRTWMRLAAEGVAAALG